jgi:hypothetical protein
LSVTANGLGFPPSLSVDVHDSGDTVGTTRRHLAIKQVYTSIHDVVLDMGPLKSVPVGGFAKVVWQYLKLVALPFSPTRALALPRSGHGVFAAPEVVACI